MAIALEKRFPLLIVTIAIIAITCPQLFLWIQPHISILLGIIMFCIGLTLDENDFKKVFALRNQIVILTLLKYLSLPLIAFLIAFLLRLPKNEFVGLMIISACPGGTAASVMSYLSKSNVALTVSLTFLTTLVSPIVTPVIIYLSLDQHISIPIKDMMATIFWIVLFPLVDGLLLRKLLKQKIRVFKPILPFISMIAISLLIACVVAINHGRIRSIPIIATLAVLLVNLFGLLIGYLAAKILFKFDAKNANAIAFEFGILDTGMAVMLAAKFFGVSTSLCGALFSAVQNITGIGLIKFFRSKVEYPQKEALLETIS